MYLSRYASSGRVAIRAMASAVMKFGPPTAYAPRRMREDFSTISMILLRISPLPLTILILPLLSLCRQFLAEVLIKAMHESFTSTKGKDQILAVLLFQKKKRRVLRARCFCFQDVFRLFSQCLSAIATLVCQPSVRLSTPRYQFYFSTPYKRVGDSTVW